VELVIPPNTIATDDRFGMENEKNNVKPTTFEAFIDHTSPFE
jgi:hypothetical protein